PRAGAAGVGVARAALAAPAARVVLAGGALDRAAAVRVPGGGAVVGELAGVGRVDAGGQRLADVELLLAELGCELLAEAALGARHCLSGCEARGVYGAAERGDAEPRGGAGLR